MMRDIEAEENRYRIANKRKCEKIDAMIDELFKPKVLTKKTKALKRPPPSNLEEDCFQVFDQSL
jgi:hypothetical protein